MKNDPTIIYIASASRSGSTLIEEFLSRNFGGLACGELYRISKFANGDGRSIKEDGAFETCACGRAVMECPFWCAVSKEAGLDFSKAKFQSCLSQRQRTLFRTIVIICGSRITHLISRFIPEFKSELRIGENCLRTYRAISRVGGMSLIVDSSKQAHQYYILKAVAPENIRLVTLLRDGRAVVSSMTRGARGENLSKLAQSRMGRAVNQNVVIEEAIKAWSIYTIKSLLAFAVTNRQHRSILRYEAFCQNPDSELDRLARHFSLNKHHHQPISHAIGGSPSRNTIGFDKIEITGSIEGNPLLHSSKPLVGIGRFLNWSLGYGGGRFVKQN